MLTAHLGLLIPTYASRQVTRCWPHQAGWYWMDARLRSRASTTKAKWRLAVSVAVTLTVSFATTADRAAITTIVSSMAATALGENQCCLRTGLHAERWSVQK